MKITYTTLTHVAPRFFILSRDGKIRVNTQYKEVVGTWIKFRYGTYSAELQDLGIVTTFNKEDLRKRIAERANKLGIKIIEHIDNN